MRVRLIRHATLRVEMAGRVFLVDPMLDDAGARAAVAGTANERRNPLVPLSVGDVVSALDAVLVTHLHADHPGRGGNPGPADLGAAVLPIRGRGHPAGPRLHRATPDVAR